MDSFNDPAVKNAIEQVSYIKKNLENASIFSPPLPTAVRCDRKRFSAADTVSAPRLEEDCGLSVWKDRNFVVFYCNDLDSTMKAPFMELCGVSRNVFAQNDQYD